MNKKEHNKEVEEIIELSRDVKIAEEEIIKQSIEEKNKLIEQLKNENKELNKQLLYLKAEFENYRKRVEKEKQQKFIFGKISVYEKIISLYEILSYALNNLEKDNTIDSSENSLSKIIEGIKLLHKEFENLLNKEGIKKIECLNKTFDPSYHEVLEIKETDTEDEDNKIIEVIYDGYLWSDGEIEYTIKPAKVKITKFKPLKDFETNSEVDSSN
ncbi:MAG: nucleotide exchange factor GrpE [Elusimicrobiota bacterium]|nr:nucleotide exchange factor GrpE [Endomicrobiia bacterium]MCX7910245.1 nucleotide exchange factor GrpE [Endomicrobiia bacterium]MDW8165641.1 nucleotide exchange factor GrpE [Elusimicrobiota bacterium]